MFKSFFVFVFFAYFSSLFAAYVPSDALVKEMLHYRKQYQLTPTSNKARFDLAMVYAYTGAMEEGFAKLKEIDPFYAKVVLSETVVQIKANPNEWRFYFKRAFGYYFVKDYESAVAAFKGVLKIDPDHVWAMSFIAFIKGEEGKLDEAMAWVERARTIEPDAAACHFLMGEIYRRKKRYLLATSHFVKCMHNRTLEQNFRASLE
eukprot:COSAG01_NODE_216_length_21695_cov_83.368772_12_plen_204_part_00